MQYLFLYFLYNEVNIRGKKEDPKTEISDHRPYRCLHYTYVTKTMADAFLLHSREFHYYHQSGEKETVFMLIGPDGHKIERSSKENNQTTQ